MTWVAAATIGSGVLGAFSSSQASRAQQQAQREAIAAQERMFNRQVELQEPFRTAGVNALPDLIAASRYTPFDYDTYQNDPGVGFRFREGLKALQASKAAGGMLRSGNTLRGITQFGQDLASQEYTNAFNRYQAERQARLNPLQSLAGVGQTATNTLSNEAGQYGQAMANNAAAMGNIRASGYMGAANALAGGLGQYANYRQNQDFMDKYFAQRQPPAGAPKAIMI
ncbi:hypothetical protein UFOVP370_4 [uncultured Caudovirales phage]|uniref:DNA transfer protein n=1 Tax=uncultured Caudovirales phage TaxID=2100421 RepID=A0A6J7WX94_9CAUD|nr:hypothetical protein UFOVP370_4 [uncultured Caudovirales phage]